MRDLPNQELFETMWFHNKELNALDDCREDHSWIVYFTAAWCGPCKKLNMEQLDKIAKSRNLTIWKCDETINNYTAGYCGVKSFPTFIHFQPKTIVSKIQPRNTEEAKQWLESQ